MQRRRKLRVMRLPGIENLGWIASLGKPGSFLTEVSIFRFGSFLTGGSSIARARDSVHLADQNAYSSPNSKVMTAWFEAMFNKTPRLDLK